MTRPDQPAPGEDIAKGNDPDRAPGAAGGEPGDPDPRDPTQDASDPQEPPD